MSDDGIERSKISAKRLESGLIGVSVIVQSLLLGGFSFRKTAMASIKYRDVFLFMAVSRRVFAEKMDADEHDCLWLREANTRDVACEDEPYYSIHTQP